MVQRYKKLGIQISFVLPNYMWFYLLNYYLRCQNIFIHLHTEK